MAFVRVESLIVYRALDLFRSSLSQYLVNAVGLWTQSVLVYLGKRYILSAFLECRMQEVSADTKSLLSIFFPVSGVEHIDPRATNFFECPFHVLFCIHTYIREGGCYLLSLDSSLFPFIQSVGGGGLLNGAIFDKHFTDSFVLFLRHWCGFITGSCE